MKYILLTIFALLNWSCGTQKVSKNSTNSLKTLIRSDKNVYVENKVFYDEIDFTSFIEENLISHGIYQVNIKSSITFNKCTFLKQVNAFKNKKNNKVITSFLGNLSFIECEFRGEANFRGCTVYGRTDFTNSNFKEATNFEEANFFKNTYFNGCRFEKETRFQNSFFLQKVNFMNTEYKGVANFQNSVFNSELQFSVSKFYKYADFSLIDCRSNIFFNFAEFLKRADFSNSSFGKNIDFNNSKNVTTNFSKCLFKGKTNFFKLTVRDIINFENAYFLMPKPQLEYLNEKVRLN